ncbi:MAG TPA: TRAP transporter small permease [Verrucomicrobiales bacterium]|jgi:TRAP-type C4-dicarboxylate transport system permease small subunit|nr:TRAP transporter small permease [Verrucomicrobiales bacterium]
MKHALSTLAVLRKILVKPMEWFLILGMTGLTLDVLWGVFSRYALGAQSRWTEELAIYLLIWISLLGASLVYGEQGHLGVDYFVKKLDSGAQKIAAICVEGLVLFFAFFAMVGGGWTMVVDTLADGSVSPALGWKLGHVYAAVPISGALIVFFAVQHSLELIADGFIQTGELEKEMSDV